mgnify:CR=1 FL=1
MPFYCNDVVYVQGGKHENVKFSTSSIEVIIEENLYNKKHTLIEGINPFQWRGLRVRNLVTTIGRKNSYNAK